ncbi:MAG: 30S ribosomal protein S17 [Pyrodictiaceae archaeon]
MSLEARNIGIPGVKPPEKTCNDPLCPWHGKIRVRGIILQGVVIKAKMQRTVVVEREYLYYDRKYRRYERRRSRIHAHNPPCIDAKEGDVVIIGETRPIAKTVHFVVLGIVKRS